MKVDLFSGDFLFTGSHETKARALIQVIDNKSQSKIFSSAVELFKVAALVGCINNRTAQKEKSSTNLKIMAGQLNGHRNSIMYIYKLVLLCADSADISPVDRMDRAFREYSEDYNYELFVSYVLGGVDELYAVFFDKNNVRYNDYLNSLKSFLKENLSDNESEPLNDEDIFGADVF